MFYILTFSYAVVVIGPLLLCLLVPGTIAECGLALTYMSAFKSTTTRKKKKAKDKDEKEDDDDEEEDEEEKGKKYRWSNHIALSRRLTELTREHFEGLFYDWSPPPPSPLDSSDAHSSSASPSSSSSPNDQPPNLLHQAAALWLRQTDHLLVQSAADWPSLISLRNGLQVVEREQGAAISSLQRSLLTVQKALLPLITAARRQQRQNQQQQQPNQQSSSPHLSHHSSELLEQSETLLRGWCRRVKALKTLHV